MGFLCDTELIGPVSPPAQAPIVHPDKLELFPGVARGGGFQLWAPAGKGPPLRAPPGDTLPGLDATEGRHIIGKVCPHRSPPICLGESIELLERASSLLLDSMLCMGLIDVARHTWAQL